MYGRPAHLAYLFGIEPGLVAGGQHLAQVYGPEVARLPRQQWLFAALVYVQPVAVEGIDAGYLGVIGIGRSCRRDLLDDVFGTVRRTGELALP